MEPPSHDYCLSCTEARERIIQGACKVEWQMANELRLLPSSEHVLFGSTLAYALLTASPLLSKEEPPSVAYLRLLSEILGIDGFHHVCETI